MFTENLLRLTPEKGMLEPMVLSVSLQIALNAIVLH